MAELSEEDMKEINTKVRELMPLPDNHEKMCQSQLSKFFARRDFKKKQLIKIKKKEYEQGIRN